MDRLLSLPTEQELEQSPNDDYLGWLRSHFPNVVTKPFAPRHLNLWDWFVSLQPGVRPMPRIEVWPRGGAKSSTAELGCAYIGVTLRRRFVLYVCATQEQADNHVQSIAALFERIGVDRAVGKHGNSKGWRRNQLRTAGGFNVAAIGLDTAARGIKLDEFRPDLIILDDIDGEEDTPKSVKKKIRSISRAILPAGSIDCATLAIQNLIHEDGIVAQLVDGRADFLHDRQTPTVEPAIHDLEVEQVERPDGRRVYKITGGTPTWAGQDLETCERQINEWGLRGFLREAQHEVEGAEGFFFDPTQIEIIEPEDLPAKLTLCRAYDLAATEDGGDYTVGFLTGYDEATKIEYWLDVRRHQFESNKVRELIKTLTINDLKGEVYEADQYEHGHLIKKGGLYYRFKGRVKVRLPQDPAQAGKDQATQLAQMLRPLGAEVVIKPVSGSKAIRARGLADQVNGGNVKMVRGAWNLDCKTEFRKFREDEQHDFDDVVDSAADAHNEVAPAAVEWHLA